MHTDSHPPNGSPSTHTHPRDPPPLTDHRGATQHHNRVRRQPGQLGGGPAGIEAAFTSSSNGAPSLPATAAPANASGKLLPTATNTTLTSGGGKSSATTAAAVANRFAPMPERNTPAGSTTRHRKRRLPVVPRGRGSRTRHRRHPNRKQRPRSRNTRRTRHHAHPIRRRTRPKTHHRTTRTSRPATTSPGGVTTGSVVWSFQLRHEHIPAAHRSQIEGAGTRIEIRRPKEVTGGVHVARPIHRHPIADIGDATQLTAHTKVPAASNSTQTHRRCPPKPDWRCRHRIEICRPGEVTGGVHVARPIHRHPGAEVGSGATQRRAPPRCQRHQLRHKHIRGPAEVRFEVPAPGSKSAVPRK